MTVRRSFAAFLMLLFAVAVQADASVDPFPRPAGLEGDIAFWRSIFGEVPSTQALLHDNRYLTVVYETVNIPPNASGRTRRKVADKARERYRKILTTLASGKRTGLSAEEQRVLDLWPDNVTNDELKAATRRIRFQQGLADRYLAGLKRSGKWKSYIELQMNGHGVPLGLAALPHVESSFNPEAHSHVGASGLWQFTRSTGRRFMEIDHVVDERRDPYRSSEAAAELLAYNYSILKSWPLAITAYNHGVAGMRRAVRNTGTDDFTVINRTYKGRTFGFASRNFYLAFLAALEVEQNAEQYFGDVDFDLPGNERVVETDSFVPADELAEALGVDVKTLRAYNPALLSPVWSGTKHVPRGYQVRIPATLVDGTVDELLAAIPASARFGSQTPDTYHKVRRGESLSVIAVRYNTSVTRLMELNNLSSRHRIRAGQTLRLPYDGQSIPVGAETYTVRKGDTLGKIVQRSGVSESQLMQANNLVSRNKIYVGQLLMLRMPEDAPAAQPVTSAPVQVASTAKVAEPEAATVEVVAAEVQEQVQEDVLEPIPVEDTQNPDDLVEPVLAAADAVQTEPLLPVRASLADPNDYTVAADRTIEVQAAETLGHYADWLGLKTQRLRDINGMSFRKPVVVGRRIKLDFSQVTEQEFINRRVAFHRDMQEAYFITHRVVDTTEHKLKRGESVWVLTHRDYKVPVWLVRQYNPDLDFGLVRPGMRILFPRVERIEQQVSSVEPAGESG